MQPFNQAKHQVRRLAVQVAGRFICQQQLRPGHQRAGQSDSLLFSAAQLAGPMRGPVGQSFRQPVRRFLQALLFGTCLAPAAAWPHFPAR
jgi:hypothetical protein